MFELTQCKLSVMGRIFFTGVTAFFVFVGCTAQQHDLLAGDAMPGATGIVTLSKDNLNNTIVEITVENVLALDEKKEFAGYVAWAQFQNTSAKLGNLKVVDGNGRLISTTEMKQFEVLITSEEFSSVTKPTSAVVLKTSSIAIQ